MPYETTVTVALSLSACVIHEADPYEQPLLSESRLQECEFVGLNEESCLALEIEIDRLREAGDFTALINAYEELVPSEKTKVCNPTVEVVEGRAVSCGKLVGHVRTNEGQL